MLLLPALWSLLYSSPVCAQILTPSGEPYNFVLILTDDQRFDTLWSMPNVQAELISRGVHFQTALITTPICCPARASILSGGYFSHNTGVLTNEPTNGEVIRFNDIDTLSTRLQVAGYRTAMIGKFMNGYWQTHVVEAPVPYIPPGWTSFIRAAGGGTWMSFRSILGSSTATASGTGTQEYVDQYLTDYLSDQAAAFLQDAGDDPFFLYLAPFAPHKPAIPAPGDESLFSDYTYRGRGYGETDRSDKPQQAQNLAAAFDPVASDEFHRDQLRSLQAVDRAVAAIVAQLETSQVLHRTILFFTSDNGYLWGEHGLVAKDKAYEESIRVPLVVVVPGVPAATQSSVVAADLDIPTTILEVAGDPRADQGDGRSLLPLLDPMVARDEPVLIQSFRRLDHGSGVLHTPWSGVRSDDRYKFVEYTTGEQELYDLVADPYELENLAMRPDLDEILTDEGISLAEKKDQLADWVRSRRGIAITTPEGAPTGLVGRPYRFQLAAWGGTEPYLWSWSPIEDGGELAPGLHLDPDTGRIFGAPTRAGTFPVYVQVEGASNGTQSQRPQRFAQAFSIAIATPVLALGPTARALLLTAIAGVGLMSWRTNRHCGSGTSR